MINWDNVIDNLANGNVVTVNPARWKMSNPEYTEMIDLWESNNFNTNSVKWINYYDTKDIETQLASELNIKPIRSWISCVEPGYMTGYHYDIDDNESEYLKLGNLKRYSVFISKPEVGHLFILNKEYHYNNPQGTILEWDRYRDWHNGINGGFTNKYMLHILGY
jgi:hypothetical protein